MALASPDIPSIKDVLASPIPFLFVLSVVVFIHELGHFLVARWCGVRVVAFSLGFGREIWGFNDRHGTRWKLSWLPLGGYVSFPDDANPASTPSPEAQARMTDAERAGAFHSKKLWQKAAVIAAGPIANFILAIAIFAGIYATLGKGITPPRVADVVPGSVAEAAGFKVGDMVVSIDREAIDSYSDIQRLEHVNPGNELVFVVDREGRQVTLRATPALTEVDDGFGSRIKVGQLGLGGFSPPPRVAEAIAGGVADVAGFKAGDLIVEIDGRPIRSFNDIQRVVKPNPGKELVFVVERGGAQVTLRATPALRDNAGQIGIRSAGAPGEVKTKRFGVVAAVSEGVKDSYFIGTQTLAYLRDVVLQRRPPDQLGGPGRIADTAKKVADLGFIPLLSLVALISVSIGLLNLLPIPPLDGGHLLFYAFEALRGKPPSAKMQELGFGVGLSAILVLFVYANWNDRGIFLSWFMALGRALGLLS